MTDKLDPGVPPVIQYGKTEVDEDLGHGIEGMGTMALTGEQAEKLDGLRDLVAEGGRLEYDPAEAPDRRHRLTLPGDDFLQATLMELGALHHRGPGGEIVVER